MSFQTTTSEIHESKDVPTETPPKDKEKYISNIPSCDNIIERGKSWI